MNASEIFSKPKEKQWVPLTRDIIIPAAANSTKSIYF